MPKTRIGVQNAAFISPVAQYADPMEKPKPSNARFRSFAERYLLTRSHLFRQDPEGLLADTWMCMLDAKRAYSMIKTVGQGVVDDGSSF